MPTDSGPGVLTIATRECAKHPRKDQHQACFISCGPHVTSMSWEDRAVPEAVTVEALAPGRGRGPGGRVAEFLLVDPNVQLYERRGRLVFRTLERDEEDAKDRGHLLCPRCSRPLMVCPETDGDGCRAFEEEAARKALDGAASTVLG